MKALKIIVFNVGEGDCILLHFPTGELGLVDSQIPNNQNESPAIQYILENGGKLSFMCLTHPHDDHYGGMLSILKNNRIQVGEFWHSMSDGLEWILRFIGERSICDHHEISKNKMKAEYNKKGELLDIFDYIYNQPPKFDVPYNEFEHAIQIGDVNIWILSPSKATSKRYERILIGAYKKDKLISYARDYANRISLIIFISYGKNKIILGGDAPTANWREMIRKAKKKYENKFFLVDIYKASHHGSKDSFYDEMWEVLLNKDGKIVVSSGSIDHPNKEFIHSINRRYDIYCTNKGDCLNQNQGEIRFTDESNISLDQVSTENNPPPCYGKIEIEIFKDKKPKIYTQYQQNTNILYCKKKYS